MIPKDRVRVFAQGIAFKASMPPNAVRSIVSDARRLLGFGGLDDPRVA